MTTAAQKISELNKEVANRSEEATRLKSLSELFPDLCVHTNRWGTQRYVSASANSRVTNYETRRTCGCCVDAPRVAWFYLETKLGRVYSDPPDFYLTKFDDFGSNECLDPQFEEAARKAAIPESLIEKFVGIYRRADAPEE